MKKRNDNWGGERKGAGREKKVIDPGYIFIRTEKVIADKIRSDAKHEGKTVTEYVLEKVFDEGCELSRPTQSPE